MALEVEGSSPSSYPILSNEIEILSNIKAVLTLKNKLLPDHALKLYRSNVAFRGARLSSSSFASINARKKTKWIESSFKVFTSLSAYNRKHIMRVHHTYIHDGFTNGAGNGGFTNVRLFFSLYKKFFNLLYNLVYFSIPRLVFSSNVFREESCSLN